MNICFYCRVAGTLILNLFRRIYYDILDRIFIIKEKFNCCCCCCCCCGCSCKNQHVSSNIIEEQNQNQQKLSTKKDIKSTDIKTIKEIDEKNQKLNLEKIPKYIYDNSYDNKEYNLKKPIEKMAWFHSVNREKAVKLVASGGEGCFLVRPSSSSEPLTLTLWFQGRAYNIVIRKRKDDKIGLGTFKPNEITFDTVEELVSYYQKHELILYSDGKISGRTKLSKFA